MKDIRERKPLFEQLKKSLEEAILHAQGKITLKTTILETPDPPPAFKAEDIIRIRFDHKMSQAEFARLLNVSPKTVQSWEQGIRRPSSVALRLIQVFRHDPSGFRAAVGMTGQKSESVLGRERPQDTPASG